MPSTPPQTDAQVQDLPPYQSARRQKIIASACELLETRPYEAIHVRDVAAHAGVALGTLYRYFTSKEHLYVSVLLPWLNQFGEIPAELDKLDPLSRVTARTHNMLETCQRQPEFFKLMVHIQQCLDLEARNTLALRTAQLEETAIADVATFGDEEARDIVRIIGGTLMYTLTRDLYTDNENTKPIASSTMDTLLKLIAARYEQHIHPEA